MTTADQIVESQPMRPEADEAVNHMVTRLFDHWRLNDSDQAALLGCPEKQQTVDEAVASNESAERAGHLLAIHSKLRTLFPQNHERAYAWMSTQNQAFDGRTPVEAVRKHRLGGVRAVHAYLERKIGA